MTWMQSVIERRGMTWWNIFMKQSNDVWSTTCPSSKIQLTTMCATCLTYLLFSFDCFWTNFRRNNKNKDKEQASWWLKWSSRSSRRESCCWQQSWEVDENATPSQKMEVAIDSWMQAGLSSGRMLDWTHYCSPLWFLRCEPQAPTSFDQWWTCYRCFTWLCRLLIWICCVAPMRFSLRSWPWALCFFWIKHSRRICPKKSSLFQVLDWSASLLQSTLL